MHVRTYTLINPIIKKQELLFGIFPNFFGGGLNVYRLKLKEHASKNSLQFDASLLLNNSRIITCNHIFQAVLYENAQAFSCQRTGYIPTSQYFLSLDVLHLNL